VDLLAEGEAAAVHVSDVLSEAVSHIVEIGNLTEGAGGRIDESDARGGGFAGRLRVATELADALVPHGAELERLAADYRGDVDRMDVMLKYMITRVETASPEEQEREVFDYFRGALELSQSVAEANIGITSMAVSSKDLKKITRVLDKPGGTISRALNRFLESNNVILSWADEAQRVIDEYEVSPPEEDEQHEGEAPPPESGEDAPESGSGAGS
jgi:hypothetical protein